jgi:deoxyhypusine synthase
VQVLSMQVDVLVTTAGGIEEDLIKCLAPTYIGDFALPGKQLRSKGLNRIGNLLVPNDNYCLFEDWIVPIFDQLLVEQKTQVCMDFSLTFVRYQISWWSPASLIHRYK